MVDKNTTGKIKQELTKQKKVVSLFKFIEEINKLKQKIVLRVSDYPWWYSINDLPDDSENIKVYYRDYAEEDSETGPNTLLPVHKPEFQSCPEPDLRFEEWLDQG